MTPLLGTTDGWCATVRSVRWSPLLIAPIVSSIALVVLQAMADSTSRRITFLGDAGVAFTAASAAFIADDGIMAGAAPTPIEARTRLVARALVAMPVAVAGWLVVLAIYGRVLPPDAQPAIGSRAVAGIGVAAAALALATLFARSPGVPSPGAAGVAAVAGIALILQAVPVAWLRHLPSHRTIWVTAIVVAVPVIVAATREPARS